MKEAWKRHSTDVIMRSFEAYSITSGVSDCIQCTKEGGVAEAVREALKDLDGSLLDVDTESWSACITGTV